MSEGFTLHAARFGFTQETILKNINQESPQTDPAAFDSFIQLVQKGNTDADV